ncbi:solute carrier family 2, facilitated glucose transporter member 5-like isoform X2 [Hemicordylus capensis]|uniref:solute carrier family 2, facilitated glucose transporter member 5-like isoform X2 n=1 Tax=Hemicordylus capensis TaxID=884348 RepID=UPI002304C0D9|nr:solute carrier family 2, facilitated glucose transporter member 5-like isoform X2 [Hemicordylus capensis]
MGVKKEKIKKELTKTFLLLVLISLIGSFQFGYNIWIVNDPSWLLSDLHNITLSEPSPDQDILKFLMSLTVVIFPIGGVTGSCLLGFMVDRFGRKGTLLINNFVAAFAAVFIACSEMIHSPGLVIFSRFAAGIWTGMFGSVVPMYLGEISPTSLRGAISMLPMLFSTLGVIFALVLGHPDILGNEKGWAIMLSLPALLALLQIFFLLSCPESPRYLLIQKNKEEEAREVLKMLREKDEVEDEIEELHEEYLYEKEERQMQIFELIGHKGLQKQFICIIVLMVGQQFSGINSAYYYAADIYRSTKIGGPNIHYLQMAAHFVLLFAHVFSIFVIDFWGRRFLLLTGFGICNVTSILLTMTLELKNIIWWMPYISTILATVFTIGYTIGPSSIPFLMTTELFLQSSRSSAYVIGGCVHWLSKFLLWVIMLHINPAFGTSSRLHQKPSRRPFWKSGRSWKKLSPQRNRQAGGRQKDGKVLHKMTASYKIALLWNSWRCCRPG